MDKNQQGCLAEYTFATECLKLGYNVSFPLMDSSPYDCIVDTGERLLKIQVKSTKRKPTGYHKSVSARIINANGDYSKDTVDYFAIWTEYFNGFFIVKNKGNMRFIRLSTHGIYKDFFNNFAFE